MRPGSKRYARPATPGSAAEEVTRLSQRGGGRGVAFGLGLDGARGPDAPVTASPVVAVTARPRLTRSPSEGPLGPVRQQLSETRQLVEPRSPSDPFTVPLLKQQKLAEVDRLLPQEEVYPLEQESTAGQPQTLLLL